MGVFTPIRTGAALAALLVLSLPSGVSAQAPAWLAWAQAREGTQSYGVFMLGSRAGWQVRESRIEERDGVPVFVVSERFSARMAMEGETSTLETSETTTWSLEGQGDVLHHTSRSVDDEHVTEVASTRDGDEFQMIVRSGTQTTAEHLPPPKATLAEQQRLAEWLASDPAPDAEFLSYGLAGEQGGIDAPMLLAAIESRTEVWHGETRRVTDVWLTESGLRGRANFSTDGLLLSLELAPVFELRLEPGAATRELDDDMDWARATRLPVDRDLGPPQEVAELRLRLVGTDDVTLPSAPRQFVDKDEDGALIVSLRQDAPRETAVLDDTQRADYLAATPRIQCAADEIVTLVEGLVVEGAEPRRNARRLARWVFTEIKRSSAVGAPTALDILALRKGDCTEDALLFVTMARAAGLPAREITGLMYVDDDPAGFAWHRWAEIHDGKGWVSVDPAWNQLPVDATHIKVTAEDDLSWSRMLGTTTLQVLGVRHAGEDPR